MEYGIWIKCWLKELECCRENPVIQEDYFCLNKLSFIIIQKIITRKQCSFAEGPFHLISTLPCGRGLFYDYLNVHLSQEDTQDNLDEYREWIDGSAKHRYSLTSREAQSHSSGWAMKYTNNHNKYVLKKTCVGVLVCSENCRLKDGRKIRIRPAISDKGMFHDWSIIFVSLDSSLEVQEGLYRPIHSNKMCSHCLFPVADKSGTNCYHLVPEPTGRSAVPGVSPGRGY
jgi:hypothetical protein